MANSKVFVSPGVYTSEVDLSFVAQSVGVTTLGIAGETLKGPAFEPIFIRNFDEFQTYFGGTTPEKFVNTQIPKYEAAYIAKSYLQQSNQLFVTRILGLSGYDAGPSWSILTTANVDCSTIGVNCFSAVTPSGSCEPVCVTPLELPFVVDFTGCTNSTTSIDYLSNFPAEIQDLLDVSYETPQGGTSTLDSNIRDLIFGVITSSNPLTAEDTNISYFGSVDGNDYSALTVNGTYSATTNVYGVPSIPFNQNNLCDGANTSWYYSLFDNDGSGNYSGFSFWSIVTGITNITPITTTTTAPTTTSTTTNPCVTPVPTTTTTTTIPVPVECYSGSVMGVIYYYTGTSYTNYDDMVVATFRSRGIATYVNGNNPVYEVSNLNNVSLDMTGQYAGVLQNPYLPFGINVTNDDGVNFNFEASFSTSDAEYLTKVFGTSNFGKPRTVVPLFVEERFQSLLNYGWRKGFIRGLKPVLVDLDSAQSNASDSIGWYLDRYQTPSSPWVVSELRGTKVYNLFKFYTIADGDAANYEIKISIGNISFANGTFDVFVRDYYDTDTNPVVVEKFTNCSMDPSQNNFIAKKVGTLDGEFQLNSTYIMVEMNEDAPVDALPCGFEGFNFRTYGSATSPFPVYKTKYDFPGEVIFNPPFAAPIQSPGDNVRRTYLGISNNNSWDGNYFEYIGKQNPISTCDLEGGEWNYRSKGFHMDKDASGITISEPSKLTAYST
jgi:hypothetical protein